MRAIDSLVRLYEDRGINHDLGVRVMSGPAGSGSIDEVKLYEDDGTLRARVYQNVVHDEQLFVEARCDVTHAYLATMPSRFLPEDFDPSRDTMTVGDRHALCMEIDMLRELAMRMYGLLDEACDDYYQRDIELIRDDMEQLDLDWRSIG